MKNNNSPMQFLIQSENGGVSLDFCFALIQALQYNNWIYNTDTYRYTLLEDVMTGDNADQVGIPVGSVEFVLAYLKSRHNAEPKPVNIPEELLEPKYTKRTVFYQENPNIINKCFVKSHDRIKHFAEVIGPEDVKEPLRGNFMISELVEIESEWRAFVYKGELVGLQNYSGDFTVFPDMYAVNDMIRSYTSAPIAFTLDVGVNSSGTFIIEVHDFYSCGLYGFNDHKILPFMFSRWFHEYIDKEAKRASCTA